MLAKIFVKENNIQAAIEILSKAVEYVKLMLKTKIEDQLF